jgi:hypothetical protein
MKYRSLISGDSERNHLSRATQQKKTFLEDTDCFTSLIDKDLTIVRSLPSTSFSLNQVIQLSSRAVISCTWSKSAFLDELNDPAVVIAKRGLQNSFLFVIEIKNCLTDDIAAV